MGKKNLLPIFLLAMRAEDDHGNTFHGRQQQLSQEEIHRKSASLFYVDR